MVLWWSNLAADHLQATLSGLLTYSVLRRQVNSASYPQRNGNK